MVCGNEATPEGFEKFDDVIIGFMKDQGIPGISLAASYHGNSIYSQGYGKAGVNRAMTSSSRLRIASISKPLTAIGVMRLVETGHVTLDAKVFGSKGILNEFRPSGKGDKRILKITVRHLLQHSAGWDRDQAGDPVFFNLDAIAVKEGIVSPVSEAFNRKLVRFMMTKKLQFTPGRRHAYSNFGYLVLGLVLERLTNKKYEDYMKEIFTGLELDSLCVGFTKRVLCHRDEAEYFNNREPAIQTSIFPGEGTVLPQYGSFSMENTGAYGGWVTSGRDLLTILHHMVALLEQGEPLRDSGAKSKRNKNVIENNCGSPDESYVMYEGITLDTRNCLNGTPKRKFLESDELENVFKKTCRQRNTLPKLQKSGHRGNEINILENLNFVEMYGDIMSYNYDGLEVVVKTEGEDSVSLLSDESNPKQSLIPGVDLDRLSFSACGVPISYKHEVERAIFEQDSRFLSQKSVHIMLERPEYENGQQWYCLGFDTQDAGASFGHTGAMEGTCGTMMHHASGFNWVMLMNAWSRDMDLDGLVKYALSTVHGYPLYYDDSQVQNIFQVVSKDKMEKVFLLVPLEGAEREMTSAKEEGYMPSWVNICSLESSEYMNVIFRKDPCKWCIYFDVEDSNVQSLVEFQRNKQFHPYFVESYIKEDKLVHCILMSEHLDPGPEVQVFCSLHGKDYLNVLKQTSQCQVKCQSVTLLRAEVVVSCVLQKTTDDVVSWVQIQPEEFLIEQQKQSKRGRGLVYVKFFSLGDDTYVSALWSSGVPPKDRLQRYGASKYGFLQELREASTNNLRLQSCSAYVVEGVVNFAAVWNPYME